MPPCWIWSSPVGDEENKDRCVRELGIYQCYRGATFLWGARGNAGIRYLRVFGLLFIHMVSPLVRFLRWCVSRSCCVVYFPLSCVQLPLSLVAHVAAYCVPLFVSLYLLVTVALSTYICSIRLCATLSSLRGSSKLQLYLSSLYDITNPLVTAFCVFMALWCLSLWFPSTILFLLRSLAWKYCLCWGGR